MGSHITKDDTPCEEDIALSKRTHFTGREITLLREEFHSVADEEERIGLESFKSIVGNFVVTSSATDLFLERLFVAFDTNRLGTIDFDEYISGLSTFSKGTPEERLQLSFRLYDVEQTGALDQLTLGRILGELCSPFCTADQGQQMQGVVDRTFSDLDVDDDGKLTYAEFQLAAMKEPIFDILGQFLAPVPPPVEGEGPQYIPPGLRSPASLNSPPATIRAPSATADMSIGYLSAD